MAESKKAAIVRGVYLGNKTYAPGQESELAEVASAAMLERLSARGAISGEWSSKKSESRSGGSGESTGGTSEPAPLPTIANLEAHLAGLTDAKAVRELQKRDERVTAAPLYEARLAALKG